MIDASLVYLTLASALGCGLIAGAFFAFSTFVMKALARLPAEQGIAAMQSINVVVLNPWFLGVFLGAAVGCVLLAIAAISSWSRSGAACLLAGSLLYLVGTLLVTMLFNVPRNDALAGVDPTTADAARLWTTYLAEWTVWNHVRTIAALLASASFTWALR